VLRETTRKAATLTVVELHAWLADPEVTDLGRHVLEQELATRRLRVA
jgi:hypothetical protein